MLDESLNNELIELLAANFSSDQISELGRLLFKGYDSHKLAGKSSHLTLNSRTTACVLLDYCSDKKKVDDLVKLIIETDERSLLGKKVTIDGLEIFLTSFSQFGYVYDQQKRKIVQTKDSVADMVNWGALKDGKSYPVTVMSVDIVHNSELVKKYGTKKMEKVYYRLWEFLREILSHHNGRIWSWAGDGGILAFAFKDNVNRAVRCAIELQRVIPVFNMREGNIIDDNIELRTALDTGKIKFFSDTGKIISDVINLAAHLEKKGTQAGYVSITQNIVDALDAKIFSVFDSIGDFEGTECYTTYLRLDQFYR